MRKNLLYRTQVLHESGERSEHLGEACSAHWPTSTLGMLYSFPNKLSTAIKKRKKKENQKLELFIALNCLKEILTIRESKRMS